MRKLTMNSRANAKVSYFSIFTLFFLCFASYSFANDSLVNDLVNHNSVANKTGAKIEKEIPVENAPKEQQNNENFVLNNSVLGKNETSFSYDKGILVTGGKEAIETISGSAHLLDSFDLEKFNYSDPHQLVAQVPGVYVRSEDGYGLRPNIGIRGVSSERSQKINIMEDGILITPSPYSAPAAYYFPNIYRMSALEVLKGPASILHGPQTVGGSINMATRSVPSSRSSELALGLGSFGHQRVQASHGDRINDQWSYLLDGLYLQSDGFKELNDGGDTGFQKKDVNLKLRWVPKKENAKKQSLTQSLEIKLGYADEVSDETYLGLSDEDFEQDPFQRYIGSASDQFNSEHLQLHLIHHALFESGFALTTKLYQNRYERSWDKLDGFFGKNSDGFIGINNDILDVVIDPQNNQNFFNLLTGQVNSSDIGNLALDVTNNDRRYISQGIDFRGEQGFEQGDIKHNLSLGLRLHNDSVERNHQPRAFSVEQQNLVLQDTVLAPKVLNKGESDALSLFINDELTVQSFTFNAGVRAEHIETEFTDFLDSSNNNDNSELAILPGVGVFFQAQDNLGFLAGVNRGFSPTGPISEGSDAEAEESINFEYGLRYKKDQLSAEAIGFFSDYNNLLGRCRVSDPSPCEVGLVFNGGAVEVSGLELLLSNLYTVNDLSIPVQVNYTYTQSEFKTSFNSAFSQWGEVNEGDQLPYLPEHLLRFELGLRSENWDTLAAVKYTGEMREEAGQGAIDSTLFTQAYTTVDVSTTYYWGSQTSIQLAIDNLTDVTEVVSRRPFGARPNKPRTAIATLKYQF